MRGSWIGFVSLCLIPTPILFAQEEIAVTTPAGALHEMVLVPAGEFAMGSEEGNPDALPVHTVYLDSYYLDRYEVTNAQYQGFVTATRRTQSRFTDDSNFNDPRQPVAGVTWSDAGDYCEWAGLRLPTEAEWEKAARGVDGLTYPWGNGSPDGTHANFADVNSEFAWRDSSADDGYSFTAPVGSYPAGASPYGVHDLAGNLWEWLADWYDDIMPQVQEAILRDRMKAHCGYSAGDRGITVLSPCPLRFAIGMILDTGLSTSAFAAP